MKYHVNRFWLITLTAVIASISMTTDAASRMVKQLMPVLTVSETYSDNYLKTDRNEIDEYITSYSLGFSLGFIDKTRKIYFSYNPEYKDYKEFNNRDSLHHTFGIDAEFMPSKFTDIKADLNYSAGNKRYNGESWQNRAHLDGRTQLSKFTKLNYSETYSRRFSQTLRTGGYAEHDVNKSTIGILNQFGQKSKRGVDLMYEFDSYDNNNADEYKRLNPSGFLTYWWNPLNAFDIAAGYKDTDFDNSDKDIKTYYGSIRYIRSFTKHFDGYIKYRHSYSDRDSGDHQIYHPSVGFDWEVTEDSGISLGAGLLFQKWENNNNDDSTEPFIDINAYKIFNFSRHTSFAITGASGYSDSGSEAASLGYNTNYKAGFKLNHIIHPRLSSNLFGSYKLDQFHENASQRKDSRLSAGAGLTWNPLKWLKMNLTYSFNDFNSDSSDRQDYTENIVLVSVSLAPAAPVKLEKLPTRGLLESELF